MKFPSSFIAAGAIAAVVALYFIIRGGLGAAVAPPPDETDAQETADTSLPVVVAHVPPFEERERIVSLNGRTEAARVVTTRAEVTGVVVETPVPEGAAVSAGDVLCRLDVDARAARVAEAEATVTQRELELKAAEELAGRGHRAANQVAATQAAFDAAEAALAQARIDLANLDITAPFDGVFDERQAEVGDFLSPGNPCGIVAELDPILVVAQAAELDAAYIEQGESAQIVLATGEAFTGKVQFMQWRADPSTRTYRVEIKATNPNGAIRAGATARIEIAGPTNEAALVPTGILLLDDAGRLGVRVIDTDDVVQFRAVDVIEDGPDGAWVTGLDPRERLILRGQQFVREGRPARVVAPASEESGAAG